MCQMLLNFEGKQIPIDDEYLDEYRRTTGMDVDDKTYIPYCASNEGVSYKSMTVEELGAMVRRMMTAEMEVARGF